MGLKTGPGSGHGHHPKPLLTLSGAVSDHLSGRGSTWAVWTSPGAGDHTRTLTCVPQQTPPMPTFKRSQWRCSADLGSVTPSARFVTRSEGHLQPPRPIWVLGHFPPIRSAATARPPAGATWCAAPNARAAALLKRTPEPPPADASPSSAAHRSSLSRRRCPLM